MWQVNNYCTELNCVKQHVVFKLKNMKYNGEKSQQKLWYLRILNEHFSSLDDTWVNKLLYCIVLYCTSFASETAGLRSGMTNEGLLSAAVVVSCCLLTAVVFWNNFSLL